MATAELQPSLAQFVTFARWLKGDEKSEAQLFLDHFFRALGHGGVQEAGATLEFRKIVARKEDRTRAQRYILQLLVSAVAKDLGLLPYLCAFAGIRRGFGCGFA